MYADRPTRAPARTSADPATAVVCCGRVHDEATRRHFQHATRLLSGAVITVAALILIGHIGELRYLQTLGIGRTPATPAAAVMLAGLALGILSAGEGRLRTARSLAGAVGIWAGVGPPFQWLVGVSDHGWWPYAGAAIALSALAASLYATTVTGRTARRVRAGGLALGLAVAVPALITAMYDWELADRLPSPLDIAGPAAALAVLVGAGLSALSPHRWPNRLFYRTPEDLPLLTRVVTVAFLAPLLVPVLERSGQGIGMHAEYAGLVAQLTSAGVLLAALVTVVQQRHRLDDRVKQQRRALAASEEQFRRMFDHAPIGMATVDPSGRLLQVNRAFCELLGRRASDLEGAPFSDVTHPDDLQLDVDLFEACLRGELDRYHIEKRYLHVSGSWITGELSAALVRDERGDPRHFVGQIVDRTKERELEAELRHAAYHDPLTGLANRRMLTERVRRDLDRVARQGGAVGLVVVDLDGFKAVNDEYGHQAGDLVLTAVSQRLVDASRSFDTVARTGGDEFVICAVLTSEAELPDLVERIQRAVNQPYHYRTVEIPLAGSVGAVVGGPEAMPDDLLEIADRRMYTAKSTRRDPRATSPHPRPALSEQRASPPEG